MTRRPRRSWTPEQKQKILADARRRLADGESLRQAAKQLDLHETTLRQWLERASTGAVRPVAIIDDAPQRSTSGGISLSTPDGFFFDGLDVASAIRIWERAR